MEKEVAERNQLKEKDLKELYNRLAKENDESFINQFFTATKAERNEKMKTHLEKRTEDHEETFNDFWTKFKKRHAYKAVKLVHHISLK